jgi:hypothetical protein
MDKKQTPMQHSAQHTAIECLAQDAQLRDLLAKDPQTAVQKLGLTLTPEALGLLAALSSVSPQPARTPADLVDAEVPRCSISY